MRIAMLVLLVSLSLVVTGAAQPLVKFGIKGGVTMASMSGDGWDDIEEMDSVTIEKKFLMGMAGGLFVEFPLGASGLSLQPEFLYVTKGAKAEATANGETYTMKLNNDYIEVPVLVKYTFTSGRSASPFVFAGPVVAVNIASNVQYQDPPPDAEELGDKDVDNAKSLDFGLTIGGGLGLSVGPKGKLTFDVRYTLGLANAFDDVAESDFDANKLYLVDDETGDALKFKNTDIRFMVGYMF